MLTPVVSKKKSKKKKSKCGRELAKDIILRRALGPAIEGQIQGPADGTPKGTTPEASADAGLTSEFTPEELTRLDKLFDILSWLICLVTGDYERMNSIGAAIGFGTVDPAKAPQIRAKLKDQIDQLGAKVETMLDSPKPVPAETVSDIENEIKAYL